MNSPYFPFYTGDWLKDPTLSMCSAATRGVWVDLICAMHESDRCGALRGTTWQLARLTRCSEPEIANAINELKTTGAADVTDDNGVITVINRRMRREYIIRQQTALRQERFREKQDSNAVSNGESNGKVTSQGTEYEDEADSVYSQYPRKVSRKEALKAIKKALAKVPFEKLLDATKKFAACWAGSDEMQFCPHPSTWFNQERYNDDPSTWKRNGSQRRTSVIAHPANRDVGTLNEGTAHLYRGIGEEAPV